MNVKNYKNAIQPINDIDLDYVAVITSIQKFFDGATFKLCGVDDFQADVLKYEDGDFENSTVIRFQLDEYIYSAVEDPNDGYRSCMDKMFCVHRGFTSVIRNSFEPVKVKARYVSKGEYDQDCDIIQFWSVDKEELLILEVGTSNTGDYYPSFVGDFRVENLQKILLPPGHIPVATIENMSVANKIDGWGLW